MKKAAQTPVNGDGSVRRKRGFVDRLDRNGGHGSFHIPDSPERRRRPATLLGGV